MAKLKSRRRFVRSRDVSVDPIDPLPLDVVIDGPRPKDANADALWLELRREIGRAESTSRFDPRKFPMDGDALTVTRWHEQRRAWLADMFRDDPRVVVTAAVA